MSVITRSLKPEERHQLEALLKDQGPLVAAELKLLIGPWASLAGVLVLAWALVIWLSRKLLGVTLRLDLWSLLACALLAALAVFPTAMRSAQRRSGFLGQVRRDLAARTATEERYSFVEAIRFQEPEHGGLIYFLRTPDNKVFVLFDYESQNLGVEGKDPLASAFRPRSDLLIVRTPVSRHVLQIAFTGNPLELQRPKTLSAPPEQWPRSEEFSEVAWDQLEATFSPVNAVDRRG